MTNINKKIAKKFFPVKPPLYADKYLNKRIWRVEKSNKIHLTFDDGPTPEITIKVLDILDKYKIKATFFCLGRNIDRFTDIYQEILLRDHKTGNHTYSHLNGWKTKLSEYVSDVKLASIKVESNLFRPPYGKIRLNQINALSDEFKIIMWDVLSGDYNPNIDNETCYKNVISNVKKGSIIVFHDSVKASNNLFYTLPKVIEYFSKKNYTFGTL